MDSTVLFIASTFLTVGVVLFALPLKAMGYSCGGCGKLCWVGIANALCPIMLIAGIALIAWAVHLFITIFG